MNTQTTLPESHLHIPLKPGTAHLREIQPPQRLLAAPLSPANLTALDNTRDNRLGNQNCHLLPRTSMTARPKRYIPQLPVLVHLLGQVTIRQPSFGQVFIGPFPRCRIVVRKIGGYQNNGSLWDGNLSSGHGGDIGAQGLGFPGPAHVAVAGIMAACFFNEGVQEGRLLEGVGG